MKQLLCFFLIAFCFSCNNQKGKTDEAMIKTLNKAINVLEEKNNEHFKKVESQFQSDTADAELKKLYQQFLSIQQSKTEYKDKILKEGIPTEISAVFVAKTFEQLTDKEQEKIRKTFDQSLLMNTNLIEESEKTEVLRYELMLEAEEIVREMQLILLKDLNAKKPSFHWEYYWDKQMN